jgi:hypothetical protein
MKSLSVKLGVILFVIGLTAFGYGEVMGNNWKYYGENEEGSYSYETESLIYSSENIFRLWVKSVYTEEGLSRWIKWGGMEFQNLSCTFVLSEFNCAEKSIRYLKIIFYSKNGEVFYPMNNDEWHFFAPNSMSGMILKEICK